MNTKISIGHSLKGDLVVLSDVDPIGWAEEVLLSHEASRMEKGIEKDITTFEFPREDRVVFVQIIKPKGEESTDKEDVRIAAADLLERVEHHKLNSVTILNHAAINRSVEFLEGMVLGNYQFLKYFNDKEASRNSLEEVKVYESSMDQSTLDKLRAVLVGTLKARDLVNEPHSYLNAPTFSEEAKAAGKAYGFDVEVLEKSGIEELGMGGLLAVNQGSFVPPTFNIMEWSPADARNKRPIVLVGKGVMFDTGGVSIKPTKKSMDYMKCDMGGSATVLGAMIAIAKAELPFHVVGLVAATDNRPGNDAYLPGDVVTTMSGITVEVLNTDAEGRMTLADALHYAKRYKPQLVLDFATLTGAAAYSVGPEGICFMGNADEDTKNRFKRSGADTYERLVEFPMWREYGETIKSDIADLKNLGAPYAGMVTAGMFLQHFTDYPWLHFDIAAPAYMHKKQGYKTKEGTGVGVRLVFDYLVKMMRQDD